MKFDQTIPIYIQLSREITLRIVSGAWKPGRKIPPVREMAAEFGVNPNTMQRAMAELERQGLVYAERTAGRYVTEEEERILACRRALATEESEKYLTEMKGLGFRPDMIQEMLREIWEREDRK